MAKRILMLALICFVLVPAIRRQPNLLLFMLRQCQAT